MALVLWDSGEPSNYAGKQAHGVMLDGKWNDLEYYFQIPFFCYNEEETGASRFVFVTSLKTWHEAQSYCRQHHTDLATIRSQSENDQLQQMMQGVTSAWIGLFRDSWKWSNGANVNMSSINWMAGQPKLGGLNNRPCAVIHPNGFRDDRACSDALPFICKICKLCLIPTYCMYHMIILKYLTHNKNVALSDHFIMYHSKTHALFLTLDVYSSWRVGRGAPMIFSAVPTVLCSLLMSEPNQTVMDVQRTDSMTAE
ncbi:putative L-selectin-like [Triplophysa rosa]|uniref:L-selectin-like n=1 Tax=Triplophysa rosa TaxID=992332 RepID=A0A9W7T479_TRIRA|nr:putative L-selectin-like [Triplophysa rosa]